MMRTTIGVEGLGRFSTRGRRSPASLCRAAGRLFEQLEPRHLLAVNILNAIGNQNASNGASATVIDLANRYDNPALTGSIVRFNSMLGSFNVEMFDQAGEARTRTTPLTVANFLNYITQGRYVNNMVHRTVNNFVIQGGGFTGAPLPSLFTNVTTNPAVLNEPGNTNARGTIAMARVGGQVNSATSQWFINLANNAVPLDTTDGGFTVFGRVLGDGMNVVDAIGALPRFNFDNPFGEVPLRNYTQQDFNNEVPVHTENLVTFSTIETVNELTYSATSSNGALVTPVIVGNRLVLQYGVNMTGSANITFRITSADGSFVEDNFSVNVTNPVAPGNLAVSPNRITALGNELTLTASGPVFQNPSIVAVNFYRDLNGNGTLDGNEIVDGFLGLDDVPGDGFSLAIPVQGDEFAGAVGGQIYIARAVDMSASVIATVVGAGTINQLPVIGLFARHEQNFGSTPDVVTNLGDNLEMFALNTFDRDGTVASVQFFRDANGNNMFDNGVDELLGTDSTPVDGFNLTVSTTGFASGVQTSVFARAIDNDGGIGAVVSLMLRVNAAPTIGSLTFSAPQITRGQAITLMANMVADTDSGTMPTNRVSKVDFFRDSNGDGMFQSETDQFLTSITVGTNGVYSLTLTGVQTAMFPAGDNVFFARPTDADFAFGAVVMATIVVGNAAPTVATLTATPNPVANLGANLTLTASGAIDSDGTVARIEFYRDANGNGVFDMGTDILLGTDNTPANGFSIVVNTGTMDFMFATGVNRYFAVAFDNDNTASAAPATTTSRVNAAPTITAITSNPDPIPRNGQFTLTATGVADAGEIGAGGTISRVEFYRDTNNNGVLDIGTDLLLGNDFFAAGGYTFTGSAVGLSSAQPNRFFARAVDSENGVSTPVSVEVNSVNSLPTISTVFSSLTTVPMVGSSITLTAVGAVDTDGTIAAVRFYRDDGDGMFDAMTDTLLGQDTSAVGGFSLIVNTGDMAFGFAPGINRLFAVPVDSDDALAATAAFVNVRVNALPTIVSLTAPATVARLANITLTATDVLDWPDVLPAGPILRVEFYRDTNGNGTFELGTDQLLGFGVRQGLTNTYVLTTNTRGFDEGVNTFFVRAMDNNQGFSVVGPSSTTTAMVTNAPPLITTMLASPNPLASIGSGLTLTAIGQRDTDGTIASVEFYRDDGDGMFDPMTDTLLGTDSSAAGGFSLVVDTGNMAFGFAAGTNRYFARSVDNDGAFSDAATTTSRINAAPVITSVPAVGPVARGSLATVTAMDVLDNGEMGFNGSIISVLFYRDLNNNNVIDPTDRLLAAGVRQAGTDNWRATFSTVGFNVGDNPILVQARDNNLGLSTVSVGMLNVVNATPTFFLTSVAPGTVAFLGQNITITPIGARDPDGTVSSVFFYLETSGDDLLQSEGMNADLLIGTDTSAVGGWNLTIGTKMDLGLGGGLGFQVGTNRVYACVMDNDGGMVALGQNFNITATNTAPTIGTVTSPDAGRGTIFQIAANNVADADLGGAVSRVEFYVDTNNNNVLDIGVDRLLGNGFPVNGTARLTTFASGAGLALGMNTVFARAQDNRQVFGDVTMGTVNVVNNVPTIVTIFDSLDPVPFLGADLALTAVGVADRDGTIAAVNFYRDDGDGMFDAMTDTLLGTDNSIVGGYRLVVNTGTMGLGFADGNNRYFAQVVDNDGGLSTAATTTGRINARPTIGGVSDAGPVARGSLVTLSATNVVDTAEPTAGTVTIVRFYRDRNNNGTIELTDQLLGFGRREIGTDNFSATFSTVGFDAGANTILVQATDNNQGLSVISTATVTVTNADPTFLFTSVSPGTVPFLGQNITITPIGARDTDGTVNSVLFYLETTGDDLLQSGGMNADLLIGTDTSPVGGWSLTIATMMDLGLGGGIGFQVGANRVYACVMDNDGGMIAFGQNFNITATNAPPTVGMVAGNPSPVNRGNLTTLVATNLADPDVGGSVTRVEFFLDMNNNGLVDANVDRLLGIAGVFAGQATLLVSTQTFAAGNNSVLARAVDNRQTAGPATAGTVVVNNNAPNVSFLFASPNPVVSLGSPLTLTAFGVFDRDGTIASVDFYFDFNNDNVLDPMVDILVGSDTSAIGGYSTTVDTGNAAFMLTAATNRFFALVTDNDGGTAMISATHRINSTPVIGDIEITPIPVTRTGLFNVTLSGVDDDAGVIQLLVYRDSNLSDAFEATDLLIGAARRIGTSTDWLFTGFGAFMPVGTYKLFFQARDTNGALSAVSFAVIQVV
ncbi:MAG: peptidylprolyl isomerase [Phycisphaerales bacterium]